MIIATGLSKTYRSKTAVDTVSFRVEPGKVTGFLGPNGAGKSTTMRLMLGLDVGGGTTTYDGKPLGHYAQPSHVVGMLLEAKAFHPTRSARNHLRILAAAGRIADNRVDEVLDIVGLKDVGRKAPGKFSLGMAQRLGIAAAILGKPKYLLLDEPANGLDPEGIAWLRVFIRQYADQGNAVFISSHLLSEISQMADDVVVIGKGKLIASTSISALVNGSVQNTVFLRTSNIGRMEELLKQHHLTYESQAGGLKVKVSKTDDIGKLAFEAGVPILELTQHRASLEDVFLELTADAQEYQAHSGPEAEEGKS